MLDSETRRKIDTARDVLVGKVPDPKSQVEQITIALIYKFMDDMDKRAVEMGGKSSFFTGDFEKFSWTSIFDPRLGGFETLNLYAEAISSMSLNPNLPQLFRNIFKNAFLPYRDPETLRLFLRTINDFTYDHSEKLGDAFEYLLSVLGSQGDAGQFRTPRHIIDFIVDAVDPKKDDRILDPACGTAGFLISGYKHIMNANTKKHPGDQLKSDERQNLFGNLVGYDISPDMVRLSLVNMYLHGFPSPKIFEYDTLTSLENWNDYYDVILANPPFMSPKGGIRPHDRFQVQSNRSEVLFVDYIAEHLSPGGRAGVIVPEGIIFQSANAYKALRKYLVESNFLYAVVSLPAGVFQPYSSVKTSILLMDKQLSAKTDKVLFVKVSTDGFDLGAQRKAIDRNDLPKALEVIDRWKKAITEGKTDEFDNEAKDCEAIAVQKEKLARNDYNLSAERYRDNGNLTSSKWPMVELEEIVDLFRGVTYSRDDEVLSNGIGILRANNINMSGGLNLSDVKQISKDVKINQSQFLKLNDIMICLASGSREHVGKVAYIKESLPYCFGAFMGVIRRKSDNILPIYLYYQLLNERFNSYLNQSISSLNIINLSRDILYKFVIPLPTMEVQKKIVEEIEGYQKIIDGARQVVDNWKPRIDIDPTWQLLQLSETSIVKSGYSFDSCDFNHSNPVRCIKITNVGVGEFIEDSTGCLPNGYYNKYSDYLVKHGDLVISLTRSVISEGLKIAIVPFEWNNSLLNQRVGLIRHNGLTDIKYIYYFLTSDLVKNYILEKSRSLMQPNLSINDLKSLNIPVPSVSQQREIIDKIEAERKIVDGNCELIKIYEAKIKKVIDSLWSSDS